MTILRYFRCPSPSMLWQRWTCPTDTEVRVTNQQWHEQWRICQDAHPDQQDSSAQDLPVQLQARPGHDNQLNTHSVKNTSDKKSQVPCSRNQVCLR